MTKTAFDKIKAALEDAIAISKGDTKRGIVHPLSTMSEPPLPGQAGQ
jgi:hypothetical protein